MRRTVKNALLATLSAVTVVAGMQALPVASAATPPPPQNGRLGQLPGTDGCAQDFTAATTAPEGCSTAPALRGAGSQVVSPDGTRVFVAGTTDGGSITSFRRDPYTGALTAFGTGGGCATTNGANGCKAIAGLTGLTALAIRPDGRKLYAASSEGRVLQLNIAGDGSLSRPSDPTGCVRNSTTPASDCTVGRGIPRPSALVVSSSGSSLYVVSNGLAADTIKGAVSVFDLTADPNGVSSAVSISFRSCLQNPVPPATGCQPAPAVFQPAGIAISPDDKHVYLAEGGPAGIGAVVAVADTGTLAVVGCYGNVDSTCTPARSVVGASDAVVSPDGLNVYATSRVISAADGSLTGGGVAAFARSTSAGTLTQLTGAAGCVVQTTGTADPTCASGRGLIGAGSLAISPDNRNVYTAAALNNPGAANTANTGSSAVAVFDRSVSDTSTAGIGILAQPAGTDGCVSSLTTDGCAVVRGLKSPGSGPHSIIVGTSPTGPSVGNNVYATAAVSQAIAAFGRQGSDLRLSAVAQPGPYTVGQTYSITLSVTNAGALTATNVVLRDSLSSGATFVSATPSQGSCSVSPTVCALGTLAVDGAAQVVIRFQVTSNGTQLNTATVGADQGDAAPGDNVVRTSFASGPTTLVLRSGDGQTTSVGTAFAKPIVVSLKDNAGVALQGVQVTFSAPSTGASAFFGATNAETVVTDANGFATSSIPTANRTAGSYSVTVSSASATPLTVTLTNSSGSASPSATPTASTTQSPSPSPSPSPRRPLSLQLTSPGTITPGTDMTVQGFGEPDAAVTLRCYSRFPQNSQPGSGTPPYFDARIGTLSPGGFVTFVLRPGTNTRCFLKYSQLSDSDGTTSPSVVQNVATALSLSAYRDGVRQYHFQGRNLPRRAGQLITLYRVDNTGREIRTATTSTDSSGIWRIDRRFTGSGQFNFRARTSQTLTNVAGVSNTRLTIIH